MAEEKKLKRKKSRTPRWVLCLLALALAVAAACAVMVWDNRHLLSLPEAERGVIELPLAQAAVENAEVTPDGIVMGPESRITVTRLPGYVDKLVYTAEHPMLMDAVVEADTVNEQGVPGLVRIEDAVPQYLATSYVPLESRAERITLSFSFSEDGSRGETVLLKSLAVSNTQQINLRLLLLTGGAVFLICLLWIFRERFAVRTEQAFACAAAILGILMIVMLPTNKVSWDEEAHFYRTYCVAQFPRDMEVSATTYHEFIPATFNWPYSQPDGAEEQSALDGALNTGADGPVYYTQPRTLAGQYTGGYLVEAVFLKIGLLLRLPFSWCFRLGRLGNLMAYILLMYFAIRAIPVCKRLLAGAALMPTPLFLAATYSYDATAIGCLTLAMAIVIREILTPDEKIRWSAFLVAGAAFTVGCLTKAVYAPLILTALLIPNRKFGSRAQLWIMKTCVVLAFLAMMSTFILPTLMNTEAMTDTRGGETDAGGQIAHILADPVGYTKLLLGSIFGNLYNFLLSFQIYGQLGHLQATPLRWFFPIFILGTLLTDRPERAGQLTWGRRAAFLLLCGSCMVLIWTALYISYTPVGASVIAGVQPRYYLPLLAPVFVLFFTDRAKLKIPQGLYTGAVLSLAACATLWTVYRCMYLPFGR